LLYQTVSGFARRWFQMKRPEALDITVEYLWSMLPVNSDVKMAEVTGKQLCDWLEKEWKMCLPKTHQTLWRLAYPV